MNTTRPENAAGNSPNYAGDLATVHAARPSSLERGASPGITRFFGRPERKNSVERAAKNHCSNLPPHADTPKDSGAAERSQSSFHQLFDCCAFSQLRFRREFQSILIEFSRSRHIAGHDAAVLPRGA